MTAPLRAGLVGLGMMGRNHARVLRTLPGVQLVGVVDPDAGPESSPLDADLLLPDLESLLRRGVDMCVVATPTVTHEAIATRLAEAGVPTLIEKPLAGDPAAAERIAAAFEQRQVLGCVGHIERYNPALQSLRTRLAHGELGEVYQVATRRQGPFPSRIADIGVVGDLATHDIDLTAWVTGSFYRSVSASTATRSGRSHEDLVSAVGVLGIDVVTSHLVNWLSPLKERITTVTGERGCFVADTLMADLTYYENGVTTAPWSAVATFRGVSEGSVIRYAIRKPEPLMTELEAFAAAVRGEDPHVVTLREGLETVRVADAMLRSARTGATVEVKP
ncbi:Gfo/Idh/MocA family protein [Spirilliplanes yamanashiensis]|uniref:Dehydrogenase n=1 Tax=Spirilliplanes yamanashiensis TaxID=42233 RepID=A0A8J4DIF4_9ACTN|nr:Gfo/Idh/MocA family oxidoreductase [Spirilliplanes yamanashiensis]MDP9814462.1 putative dehydrogenase [Spirilliplanes yamanashiensis]GIJ02113.1 dehydrogenase [Spirilliplanes yamanashiensis]